MRKFLGLVALALLYPLLASSQPPAQVQVRNLPASQTAITGPNLLPCDQNGVTYACTFTQVATFTGSSGGGSGITQLTGDVLAGPGMGSIGATVVGINGTLLSGLGTGILKNTTGTGVPVLATSADVIALFTGCSGTQYLGADGACHTGGGGGASTFDQLGSGTNTTAAMLVGSGATFGYTGSGTVAATTAAALAATPSQCTGGQFATGVAASGNANCGTPTGSGTVNSSTSGQLAYYASTGTAVSGETTIASGQMPTLTGDVSNSGFATAVIAINGGSVPASAPLLASNSSSQPVSTALGTGLAIVSNVLSPTQAINAQTGTTYTILSTDASKLVTLSNASSIAVTLPQATSSFGSGFAFDVENLGAGTATITPNTSTINGAASLILIQNTGCSISSDGANYQVSACTAVAPRNVTLGPIFTLGSGTGACATTSTLVGGSTAGSFVCTGTAGASTQVVNLPTSPLGDGWTCWVADVTSGVAGSTVVPVAANSAKLKVTVATTSDVVQFGCVGY